MFRLQLVKLGLQSIIDNIDAGNSNLTEEQECDLLDMIAWMSNPESKLSKYQASKELGKSRSMIDVYIKSGKLKLREQQGFKEKFLYRRDIIKLQNELNKNK